MNNEIVSLEILATCTHFKNFFTIGRICLSSIQGKQNQTRVVPALDNVEDGNPMAAQSMTTNAAPPPMAVGGEGGHLGSNTSLQRVGAPSTLIHAAAVNGEKPALQKLVAGRGTQQNSYSISHLLGTVTRAQNTRGLRAISPDFSQNSPRK